MRVDPRRVVLGVVVAALVACGGGGGDGDGGEVAAPVVTLHPADATLYEQERVVLEVRWTGEVTAVRWQRDGVDLVNGAHADGAAVATSTIAGRSSLDLAGVPRAWNGAELRAVLTGPGGEVSTRAAVLTVEGRSVAAFTTAFEDGSLPAGFDPGAAPCALDDVMGYAGLGPEAAPFGGKFVRCPTSNPLTLTLAGLPEHASLDLDFLFAAIDSLDGTGSFPSGDFFRVDVDGTTVFRESFANASDAQEQSYVPPAGVELARKVDLGFQGPGGYYRDSAYDLGADPVFAGIPHTASTVTVTFVMEGPGIQPLTDESWAIDNLRVIANR